MPVVTTGFPTRAHAVARRVVQQVLLCTCAELEARLPCRATYGLITFSYKRACSKRIRGSIRL